MELLQKYWWIGGGLLLILLLMSRRSSSAGPTLTQVGGGAEGLAYAQLDAQTYLAEQAQKQSFIGGLLNWSSESDRISRADNLEQLRIASNERVAVQTAQYANAQANAALAAQNYQSNLAYQAQLQALKNQKSNQNWSNWLGAIFGGIDRLTPLLGGNSNDDGWGLGNIFGGYGTPPFNGSSGGGWFGW